MEYVVGTSLRSVQSSLIDSTQLLYSLGLHKIILLYFDIPLSPFHAYDNNIYI